MTFMALNGPSYHNKVDNLL